MKRFRTVLSDDSAFNLGSISGIRFRIHYSWFVIFTLVVYMLSQDYFPAYNPGWTRPAYVAAATAAAAMFFVSVLSHELAHSIVARANGMPVTSITLFIFGGVAQITREATRARAELVMAAAGPACSLVISGAFGLLWFFTQGMSVHLSAVLLWLAVINAGLAVFNLIPGYPLDGGRIFHAVLWHFSRNYHRSIRIATLMGQGTGYLFVLAGIVVAVFLYDWLGGLWLGLVGWFLASTALASYRHIRQREKLVGLTASKVMTANYRTVPLDLSLERLVGDLRFLGENQVFLAADGDSLRGMLMLESIRDVPQEEWGVITVKDIMSPVFPVAGPEQDVSSIMEQMDESGGSQVAVVSDGRVVGVVARDTVLKLL